MRPSQVTVALFDSWRGRYSDSPRALSERLAVTHPQMKRVWVLTPEQVVPPDVEAVRPFSPKHLFYMFRANVVIANNAMPGFWRKRPGCTYIQTWHGTPLKRIAWDVENPQFKGGARYLRRFSRDVARWDHLISPNRHSTEIFSRAFRYDGSILETGYPRNDLLVNVSDGDRESLRSRLGISQDITRVVLYAPTWRDKVNVPDHIRQDLSRWEASLRSGDLLLLRGHQHDKALSSYVPKTLHVRNVSSYPDIQDLLAITDCLVTDYSSILFDFAVTGRIMVFYTYDLDEYRDHLRGFYFDFEREAPGRLVRDVNSLIDVLNTEGPARNYGEFTKKYCSLEDGHASDRVLNTVLA